MALPVPALKAAVLAAARATGQAATLRVPNGLTGTLDVASFVADLPMHGEDYVLDITHVICGPELSVDAGEGTVYMQRKFSIPVALLPAGFVVRPGMAIYTANPAGIATRYTIPSDGLDVVSAWVVSFIALG